VGVGRVWKDKCRSKQSSWLSCGSAKRARWSLSWRRTAKMHVGTRRAKCTLFEARESQLTESCRF
jgi:hypothetical protein